MSMNEKPIGRTESLSPVRDDGRIVGVVSDPAVHPHKRRWEPINVDEYDNFVDDDAIEGKSGNYLFTVGNVGSGKSTLQSYFVHRLWSDPRLVFEYATADGNSAHDAYLNGWVQNIANGFFPQRTKAGKVREFTVRFGQARRPVLELGFIEIAGEEIRTIVPGSNGGDGHELGLSPYLERYLREPRIRKRFLFVSDAAANRPGSHREAAMYSEDILFDTLLRYLLKRSGVGLKRLEALFVAAKWDQVKNDYKSERHYFRENFPQTLATVAHTKRIRASFMPFSVGEVAVDHSEGDGRSIAKIVRKETRYVDTLISWIYGSFTRRRLVDHVQVRQTLWGRLTGFFAGVGG